MSGASSSYQRSLLKEARLSRERALSSRGLPTTDDPDPRLLEEIRRLRQEKEELTASMKQKLNERELQLAKAAYDQMEEMNREHQEASASLKTLIHQGARERDELYEECAKQERLILDQKKLIEALSEKKEQVEEEVAARTAQKELLEEADAILSADNLTDEALTRAGALVEQAGGRKNPVPRALKKKKVRAKQKKREEHWKELAKPKGRF